MGEIVGWMSVGLGQLVSWPQVLKLRCNRGEGVSLLSFSIVLVSMSLAWLHAVAIGDDVTIVAVPVSLVPNVLIAGTLLYRRKTGVVPRAIARGACGSSRARSRSGQS